MPNLSEGLLWYVAFLFSVVLHEAAHSYTAMKLGDRTAYEGGQVTLDPLPHIRREPLGTVLIPLISFFWGGWMIGWASAPYDPLWARQHPERSAVMSMAGPLSNFLVVICVGLVIRAGIAMDLFYAPGRINFSNIVSSYSDGTLAGVTTLLSILFSLNLILFIFNLLPLPPLDGSGIAPFFLRRDRAVAYMDFIQTSHLYIFGIFIAWKVFDLVFGPVHLAAINLLYPGHGYH